MLSELKKYNWDLENAEKICEKYNIKNALAYIYLKNGDLLKSTEVLFEILESFVLKKDSFLEQFEYILLQI